jgi:hypothetical protein
LSVAGIAAANLIGRIVIAHLERCAVALCASASAMTGTLYVAALVALVCPDSRGPWVNRIGQFVELSAFAGRAAA